MRYKTNFEKVQDFHDKFSILERTTPGFPDQDTYRWRMNKIGEEYQEFLDETFTYEFDPPETNHEREELILSIVSEIVDCLYVFYGMGASFGVDIDAAFAEIHRANMTKTRIGDNVVKGSDFQQANLRKIIFEKETV